LAGAWKILRSFSGFPHPHGPMQSVPADGGRRLCPEVRFEGGSVCAAGVVTFGCKLGGDMEVTTSRFGKLEAAPSDILLFDEGLIGLRACRRWVVLADAQNAALGWLQSIDDGDAALGIVSPRRFVPDYQLRISRQDLEPLGLASADGAQVVAIVSRHAEGLSLNLRAPLIINVETRRGRQVIAKDPLPVQFALSPAAELRRSA
jgi:flagellar assembly factor FliW